MKKQRIKNWAILAIVGTMMLVWLGAMVILELATKIGIIKFTFGW